jgi:hypothetical protein
VVLIVDDFLPLSFCDENINSVAIEDVEEGLPVVILYLSMIDIVARPAIGVFRPGASCCCLGVVIEVKTRF